MTQDERWNIRYKEMMDFMEKNHRNPSKHYDEERNMHTFVKHCKKQLNAGQLKEPVPVVPKYWTLTPYGNKMMMKLKAIKKENSAK